EGVGGDAQVVGRPRIDIDPEEARVTESRPLGRQVDFAVVSVRVVEDGADRHRTKARTPAATAAISAIRYSTTRIERSSTSGSVVVIVVWRSIDRLSCFCRRPGRPPRSCRGGGDVVPGRRGAVGR